jgi:antitoxin component of RelBE/YafQ-DinJ toxin-antitoxin module
MSTQTITARVDTDIVKIAKELAKKNWISLSSIINLKLREFINNKELKLVNEDVDKDFEIDFWPNGVDAKEVLNFLRESK